MDQSYSESWLIWGLWRLFAVMLVKAVAITLVRVWHYKSIRDAGLVSPINPEIPKTLNDDVFKQFLRRMRNGMFMGVCAALVLQMWNACEIYILNYTSEFAALVFYSGTVAFVYLALENMESDEADAATMISQPQTTGQSPIMAQIPKNPELLAAESAMKQNARQAVVIAALLNQLLKARVQLFAADFIVGLAI